MHYMKAWTDNKKLKQELLKGEFGIEKESLRVDARGYLAATPHLVMKEEQISRDFCESQVEFISGVHLQLHDACDEICELSALVEERSPFGEREWNFYGRIPIHRRMMA